MTGRIVLVSDDVVAGRDHHLEGESSAKRPPFASHVRVVLLRQRDSRKDVRWPLHLSLANLSAFVNGKHPRQRRRSCLRAWRSSASRERRTRDSCLRVRSRHRP